MEPVGRIFQNGSRVTAAAFQEANNLADDKRVSIKVFSETPPNNINQLSRWLGTLDSSEFPPGQALEIPGQYAQYNGACVPDIRSHVHINCVEPSILTMASLRKPRKITFLGTDERQYNFLAKGGEDLRTDQRVEQLFGVANEAFAQSTQTRTRGMKIRTFSVVPMTSQIGLVEWVSDTLPIKSMVEREAHARSAQALRARGNASPSDIEDVKKWNISRNGASDERTAWLGNFGEGKNKAERVADAAKRPAASLYMRMNVYAKPIQSAPYAVPIGDRDPKDSIDCASAVEAWEKVMQHVPIDLLRSQIQGMSRSPDGYLLIRNNFMKTLAAFSIVGWVLGIGDRHLDNWLVDMKNGDIVPIDFGAAFGYATTSLPVPELLPFRMTPQLIGVLSPMPALRILKIELTSALRALCETDAKRTILGVMEVFAAEPTMDWKAAAERKTASGAGTVGRKPGPSTSGTSRSAGAPDLSSPDLAADLQDGSSPGTSSVERLLVAGSEAWLPRVMLLIARLKLSQANPAGLLLLDLRQNSHFSGNGTKRYFPRLRDPQRTVVKCMKDIIFGAHDPDTHIRARDAMNQEFPLTSSDRRLLEVAIGAPLTVRDASAGQGSGAMKGSPLDVPLGLCPTIESQVDCLLDLATDPNVLARQWAGLAPWF